MDPNPLPLVIRALERAALQSTVLPYKRFHVLFERTVPLTRRYEVLDAALRELNDGPDIDYGVLLACDNGLPGPDLSTLSEVSVGQVRRCDGRPAVQKRDLERQTRTGCSRACESPFACAARASSGA
ncbi:hypothetical protein SBC1_34110 [Caballeronia sp. SBC1]|uniref:hypothetical protein n=1 Tax=Caballeronia sp. SBC1 TaxID=2705548 RepID=UPI00140EB8AC|nr:hypothetical protein [Caballeronia sp. SBC1]QIN63372.1 hypothetical protein SBC1_34110 [Caballeronia sp. SBC1]